jgi:hypothetical protein
MVPPTRHSPAAPLACPAHFDPPLPSHTAPPSDPHTLRQGPYPAKLMLSICSFVQPGNRGYTFFAKSSPYFDDAMITKKDDLDIDKIDDLDIDKIR